MCGRAFPMISVSMALACGSQAQAGLANAPSIDRQPSSSGRIGDGRPHDAIANGHESCARGGEAQDDPLRGRIPPCPRSEPHEGP